MRRATPSHLRRGAVVRVQSYNVGDGPDAAKVADLRRMVKAGAHVIGGQEFGDRPGVVAAFLREHPSWRVAWDSRSNPGRKTPILWDSRVGKRRMWRQVLAVAPGRWLGRGAGPSRSEPKNVNSLRIKTMAGPLRVLNTHLVPSAERGDIPAADRAARQRAWRAQASRFFRMALTSSAPVVGMGDWNAERGSSLFDGTTTPPKPKRVRGRLWTWDSTGPTHGARTIDLIGHVAHPRLRVIDRGVMPTSSDHDSPWVEYEIQPKRKKARR